MTREYGTGTVYVATDRKDTMVGEVIIDGKRRRVYERITPNANTNSARNAAEKKAEREVSRKLSDLLAAHRSGELPTAQKGRTTVASALDLWLGDGMPRDDRATKTVENSEWATRMLRAELGTKRLAELSASDVERALRNIAEGKHRQHRPGRTHKKEKPKPVSRRTLVLARATLRRVLAFAARRGLVAGAAAMSAEWAVLPQGAPSRVPRQALDPDQARRLWTALEGETLGAMFRTMLLTGMRPGEAAALCWDAVDIDNDETPPASKARKARAKKAPAEHPTVTVRRGLQMHGNRAVITDSLKTEAAGRTIAVLPEVAEILRAQRATVAEMRIAAGPRWTDHDLCFPTSVGTPWNPSNSRDELARISTAAGLRRVLPNELRHSCASLLSDRGVPHARIADLLGHTTTAMVDSTYRHNIRAVADAAVLGGLGDLTRPAESS